jgi:uncharacterized protein (TIGR02118 family)
MFSFCRDFRGSAKCPQQSDLEQQGCRLAVAFDRATDRPNHLFESGFRSRVARRFLAWTRPYHPLQSQEILAERSTSETGSLAMHRPTLSGTSSFISTPRTRRDAIGTAGKAAAGALLASAFGSTLAKADASGMVDIGMPSITVIYPAGPDIKFDADYYRDHHLKTIMSLYGNSIKRFELRKTIVAAGGPAPQFSAAVNIWIADQTAFAEAGKQHGPTLVKDVPNFTNGMPTIQNDVVYGEAGMGAEAMKVGDRCMTILYPHTEGDHFNYDYYRDHHLTTIMKLYGSKAISRYEMRKGLSDQAGTGAPAYNCTVGIYIEDQKAFDEAGKMHTQTLVGDVHNFSPVNPVAFPTEIYGVANT